MNSIYLRCTPAVAHSLQLFKESIDKADMSPEHALRTMPAERARHAASAVYQTELVVPNPGQNPPDGYEPSAAEFKIALLEIDRLEMEPVAYRQRLEEAESKAARDREQAAQDIVRVLNDRDDAMRLAVKVHDELVRELVDEAGQHFDFCPCPAGEHKHIEAFRQQLEAQDE